MNILPTDVYVAPTLGFRHFAGFNGTRLALVKIADIPEVVKNLGKKAPPTPPAGGSPAGGSQDGDGGTADDARTLWVEWDSHGERYRDWRDVASTVLSRIAPITSSVAELAFKIP